MSAGTLRPSSRRQPMASTLDELHGDRQQLDARTVQWVAEVTPAHLSASLRYANMAGVVSTKPFAGRVQHLFNHQTHHRGQVKTLLFQCGVDIGVTDRRVSIAYRPDDPGAPAAL